MAKRNSPFVRGRVILPALLMVQEAGEDVHALARRHGIPTKTLFDPEALVPVPQCNAMLSEASELLGDPYLGASVGRTWANSDGPPFEIAKKQATNLGHLLTLLAAEFATEATTGHCELKITATQATFIGKRQYQPGPLATFGAAAFTSFIINLIKQSADDHWDPERISVLAPVENVLPASLLPSTSLASGSASLFQFNFPVEWLSGTCRFSKRADKSTASGGEQIDPDLVGLVKTYLDTQIPGGDTSLASAARAFTLTIREFQKGLEANGTSFRELLLQQKMAFAQQRLANHDTSIKDLANLLGYGKTGNFSRAFRTATGETPTAFQRSRKTG